VASRRAEPISSSSCAALICPNLEAGISPSLEEAAKTVPIKEKPRNFFRGVSMCDFSN
jgi:hypothetical protein